jgi:hypothetical protein
MKRSGALVNGTDPSVGQTFGFDQVSRSTTGRDAREREREKKKFTEFDPFLSFFLIFFFFFFTLPRQKALDMVPVIHYLANRVVAFDIIERAFRSCPWIRNGHPVSAAV